MQNGMALDRFARRWSAWIHSKFQLRSRLLYHLCIISHITQWQRGMPISKMRLTKPIPLSNEWWYYVFCLRLPFHFDCFSLVVSLWAIASTGNRIVLCGRVISINENYVLYNARIAMQCCYFIMSFSLEYSTVWNQMAKQIQKPPAK